MQYISPDILALASNILVDGASVELSIWKIGHICRPHLRSAVHGMCDLEASHLRAPGNSSSTREGVKQSVLLC